MSAESKVDQSSASLMWNPRRATPARSSCVLQSPLCQPVHCEVCRSALICACTATAKRGPSGRLRHSCQSLSRGRARSTSQSPFAACQIAAEGDGSWKPLFLAFGSAPARNHHCCCSSRTPQNSTRQVHRYFSWQHTFMTLASLFSSKSTCCFFLLCGAPGALWLTPIQKSSVS